MLYKSYKNTFHIIIAHRSSHKMVSKSIVAILLSLLACLPNSNGCKCRFEGDECKIFTPASSNKACICHSTTEKLVLIRGCFGVEVDCANPESPHCKNPDTSRLSCLQGRGYCEAYPWVTDWQLGGCSCSYSSGGCSITKRAPNHYACRCHYVGAWTCWGRVELCDDFNSTFCKNPDTSLESCKNGRGDSKAVGYGDCSAKLYYN